MDYFFFVGLEVGLRCSICCFNEEVYSPRRQQTIITMSSEHAKTDMYMEQNTDNKILRDRKAKKRKNLLDTDSNVIKFTKNNVFNIVSRYSSSNIKFTL